MEFIRFNGNKYLQAIGTTGHVALSCPDCGAGSSVELATYFGPASRVDHICQRCVQVVFPVVHDHEKLWADAHEVWNTNEFGKQVGQLRKFGVPIGRLKERPFTTLHQALADFEPVLAYACQWITEGDLAFALEQEDVRARVGEAATLESCAAARELAARRIAAQKQSAHLVTADTTRSASILARDDAATMIGIYAMLVELEHLARTGEPRHAARLRTLSARVMALKRLLSGEEKLPDGHTRLDFVTDEAATLARTIMEKVEEVAEVRAVRAAQ